MSAITKTGDSREIELAGRVADAYASRAAFADYAARQSSNTLRAQRADLAQWAAYLCDVTGSADCPDADALQTEPLAWRRVSWGLVAGFVRWMLARGYAIASINRRLATVRRYCRLATQAGAITPDDLALILTVRGYGAHEARRINERRVTVRVGSKKAANVSITPELSAALKAQPDTPQGRRDRLMMCLLLDHGLRVGELALLQVTDVDMKAGTFTLYRPKVNLTQTHRLSPDTARALAAWMATDAPGIGALLRGSKKGGALAGGMSERAIFKRVRALGAAVGLDGLSPHDCRHYWATRAAAAGTDAFALRDAGGWSSLAMPSRYVEAASIANDRVRL